MSYRSMLLCLLVSALTVNGLQAQQVKLLTVSEMEKRISSGKDTTYVINFWATWCAPCVAELPEFEKLQESLKNKPVKVLLVSVDFRSKLQSAVIPFVQKKAFRSEVFLLNEPNQQEYIDRISKEWSGAIPATLFVNSSRRIRTFYEKEFTYNELVQTYQTLK